VTRREPRKGLAMKCKECGKELVERRCEPCGLIATWYNERTGEVHSMTSIVEHEGACEEMQYQLDSAFDNQYFSDEGW
jgi:hypothetical protein